jgi:hypothetical protein
MRYSEEDIREAASKAALGEAEAGRLIDALRALPRPAGMPGQSFDLVHILWYAGALIVIGAMGLFSTLAFEQMGGTALTVTALIYAALFLAAGHRLWRRDQRTPGGLLVAVAVAMAPLAVYGIQDATGAWGAAGDPGRYRDFYVWIKGGWVPMEIATIAAGIAALAFYPFPFIVAVIAVALWFMSMDLALWLFGVEDASWSVRRTVSVWFGLGVLAVAWMVDLKRPRERDFAFWLHLCGLAAFWCGLTFTSSSSEVAKAAYCLVNVALVGLSVFLGRRAYAVFGGMGVATYLGHLASIVFANSLLFPFALSLIGVAIIAAGLFLHRRQGALAAWMAAHLPDGLRRLRPAHASTL